MNLLDALKRHEGKTLEFKRDLSSPEGALRDIVAFANTAGGTLFVGVADRTRNVRGLKDPMAVEERLANLISDRIAPRLVPDIEILPWRRTHVLRVQVYPSGSRPHHIVSEGEGGGTYVRVGSTNRKADQELIAGIRRASRGESFDEQGMPELDARALDFQAATELFAPVRKLTRAHLDSLDLVTRHQGRMVPTIGGFLLFGKERETYFPDAWIHAARFGGVNRRRISDTLQIKSLPATAVGEAVDFVRKHSLRGVEIGAVRGTARWNIPPVAVREAVVNAVAHADYSLRGSPIRISVFDDRVEIESPGLLPFGVTVEDIKRGLSKLRNRVIARVFQDVGLIERLGSGVNRILESCREAGLPEPEFEEISQFFRVTLHTVPSKAPDLDQIDTSILDALANDRGHSTSDLAALTGQSHRATLKRLTRLLDLGLLLAVGSSPTDPRRLYYLARD